MAQLLKQELGVSIASNSACTPKSAMFIAPGYKNSLRDSLSQNLLLNLSTLVIVTLEEAWPMFLQALSLQAI